ncbi:MAG: hydroxymethylglutaryl-CoA reductase, degradative [Thermoplasmatota archaeon]|nr:hydroxymethylglutaryl-CoA reductase, degradative [Candidatus Thermoplasmatota archaeon]MBU1914448.1 hydroxymethylglutaryl-CoA reductase, degradative [Candidatus Thermoplasmatota archaeon]
MERSSRIEGFYKLSMADRLKVVKEFAGLTDDEAMALAGFGGLDPSIPDKMVENAIGSFQLPLGIAVNFRINNKDYLVPMAIEEPSVVAAASNAAKMARELGGFWTSSTPPIMIGQVQVTGIRDPSRVTHMILEKKREILEIANEQDPMLVKLGGGAKDLEVRIVNTLRGPNVIVHLLVDVKDAMGANAVNTMAEAVAPFVEQISGGKVYLRILSNLATHRLARARAVWSKEAIGGEEVVDGVIEAYVFAEADPYRCATHNKGIMNGIDSVIIATGNDFRAIEAGAHSYAARSGVYKPLTTFEKTPDGDLIGTIELPMAVGLVGGATKVHPTAKACVKLLGVKSAQELGEIAAAVGLAQNLAALRALATVGIQRGHMTLHAKNIVASVGCPPELVDEACRIIIAEKKIRMDRAQEVVEELKRKKS